MPEPQTTDVIAVRRRIEADILALPTGTWAVAATADRRVSWQGRDVGLRIVTPEGRPPFPLLVYLHGAGWVAGSVDTHDAVCRCLADRVGCIVASVDYRLAPEHRFPAALEESHAAWEWVVANAARIGAAADRRAVAGDSAGANLAAAVCLLARDRRTPGPCFQLLVNPALDFTAYEGPAFEQMRWFRSLYLRDAADRTNPYASPLLAADLTGLPPAFIITGENDPLRDEGEVYARRLRDAGVPTNAYRQAATGHLAGDFARATAAAREALDLSVATLRAALHPAGRES